MAFVLEDLIQENMNFVTNRLQSETIKIKSKLDGLLYNFQQFVETGDVSHLEREFAKYSNFKENCEPIFETQKMTRQKKGVLTDITQTNVSDCNVAMKIKIEKLSDTFSTSAVISEGTNKSLASSNEGEMPAPKRLPPRKRKIKEEPIDIPKRSTRTRKQPQRFAHEEVHVGNMSDVVIQNTTVTTIDVTDESDELESVKTSTQLILNGEEEKQVEQTRSKRTRTVKKAKVDCVESQSIGSGKQEEQTVRSKRTRTVKKGNVESVEPENNSHLVNEPTESAKTNALGNVEPSNTDNPNATYVAKNENIAMNCTVVIEKSALIKNDGTVLVHTPQKPKNKKEIFSPYDKVSTKDKVQAFEKLTAVTKTNKNAADDPKKPMTPITTKFPSKVHSTTKVNKFINREGSSAGNNSLLSTKSQSALKASQAEFRERLKKKQEKEQEAIKKREALMLALTEEKRKRREEKQLKALQQREMLEKEKMKAMEIQKLKEEKYKQAVMEKEEKLQKQKEENEKKLLLAKKRAEEIKLKERNNKLLTSNLPVYMTSEAPLLPTDDCYDSDDSDSERIKPQAIPDWSRDYELKKKQLMILKIGEKLKNTFFCRQVYSPDLQEIFERIDPRKLKRTSSAVWRKPPRYTFFLESSSIQFSEDDE